MLINKDKGVVYIVGAGPGDPNLLTLKAKKVIEIADVILYDRLVNPAILDFAKSDANKIFVGKEPRKHRYPQEEINKLMLKFSLEGKIVARLKGGDPYIFGRGSEEALFLYEHNIPFEVIPGITAGIGASTYAGIPLSHRSLVTQILFLTAHEDPTKEESQIDLQNIAKMKNTTIVVYMGASKVNSFVEELIRFGFNKDAPVAVVENATINQQRTFVDKLENIPQLVQKENLAPPLLTIISPCAEFSNKLNWFEKRPLFKKRFITTRSLDQSKELFQLLSEEGAEIIPFPVFQTQGIHYSAKKLLSYLNYDYDWIIFTSQNGVRYFMENLKKYDLIKYLLKFKIAVLGPNTAEELSRFNLKPHFMPKSYTSLDFIFDFFTDKNLKKYKILRIKGDFENDPITNDLKDLCKEIETLTVYKISKVQHSEEEVNALLNSKPDGIIFTASITVKYFFEILGNTNATNFLKQIRVFAIGPMTEKELVRKGIKYVNVSKVHTIKGIVELMKDFYTNWQIL
ncbi:MAG: uroporphyrinogen-III C-methyltransferase [Ignavibacteria bacterium]|nr:uroporphyrinogen-III C-methyltransferase [Ignavibacteria bacterium]